MGALDDDRGGPEVAELMRRLARGAHPERTGALVLEHLETGGKRLRSRLALAAVEAFGAPRLDGVGWAAACELLHNGTLIHDDLQDGDTMRRGHPTTWARHGMPAAINAGDLLLVLPSLAVAEIPRGAQTRWQLASLLAAKAAQVIRGQTAELDMTREHLTEWPVYDAAIQGKTSALFELPVAGAALLAGKAASEAEAEALARPFRALGAMFQMQDDVLDLFGEKGRDVVGADLREGKVSALVIAHLDAHPQDREWLLGLLALPREATRDEDVRAAAARFRDGGALAAVCSRIAAWANVARAAPELGAVPPLESLMRELVERVLDPIRHVAPRW